MPDTLLPQEFIRLKRDGKTLPADAIADFVTGIADGSISEGQAAAFAMAVFLRGMGRAECVALTAAMRDSGDVLEWDGLSDKGPILDKHSTGGVGDNVSLMLAPMLAAAGGHVPMISGRGLGHTGGTLDKLDAIPGYTTQPSNTLFRDTVAEAGCAIIGQTGDLAPADKRLYGIRDVTATVESVPLITASILSKKLAAGLQALVLDVKTGSGAFAESRQEAEELATSLVSVANGAGLATTALITDMNEPLASAAGNAVEVKNAIDFLTGAHRDARLESVTLALGAELLVGGGLAPDVEAAIQTLHDTLESGAAAERFARMTTLLGGPGDILENVEKHLPLAPIVRPVDGDDAGTVAAIDTRALGLAVVELGGGRRRADDAIDHAVGLTALAGIGDKVGPERPLAMIHARDEASLARASARVQDSYTLGSAPAPTDPVLGRIGPEATT